jgi:hypothetical protein
MKKLLQNIQKQNQAIHLINQSKNEIKKTNDKTIAQESKTSQVIRNDQTFMINNKKSFQEGINFSYTSSMKYL